MGSKFANSSTSQYQMSERLPAWNANNQATINENNQIFIVVLTIHNAVFIYAGNSSESSDLSLQNELSDWQCDLALWIHESCMTFKTWPSSSMFQSILGTTILAVLRQRKNLVRSDMSAIRTRWLGNEEMKKRTNAWIKRHFQHPTSIFSSRSLTSLTCWVIIFSWMVRTSWTSFFLSFLFLSSSILLLFLFLLSSRGIRRVSSFSLKWVSFYRKHTYSLTNKHTFIHLGTQPDDRGSGGWGPSTWGAKGRAFSTMLGSLNTKSVAWIFLLQRTRTFYCRLKFPFTPLLWNPKRAFHIALLNLLTHVVYRHKSFSNSLKMAAKRFQLDQVESQI